MAAKAKSKAQGRKVSEATAGPGTREASTAAAAQPVLARVGLEAEADLRRIKVIATRTGYYQHKRRREGDVFLLVPLRENERDFSAQGKGRVKKDPKTKKPIPRIKPAMEQFSDSWMEFADEDEAMSTSTSKDALQKEHDRILRDKMGLDDPNAEDLGSIDSDDPDLPEDDPEGLDSRVVGEEGSTGNRSVI